MTVMRISFKNLPTCNYAVTLFTESVQMLKKLTARFLLNHVTDFAMNVEAFVRDESECGPFRLDNYNEYLDGVAEWMLEREPDDPSAGTEEVGFNPLTGNVIRNFCIFNDDDPDDDDEEGEPPK